MAKKGALIIRILKYAFLVVLIVLVVIFAMRLYSNRVSLDYSKHLDDVVATVDGVEIHMRDLAFYIAYEELSVEEQALVYNRERTRQFWNMHTNHSFVQSEAKQAVLDMAIHDTLFYELAVKENIGFTESDKIKIENGITDFWEDLLDEQIEKMPVTVDEINNQIKKAAMAEKYQNMMAEVYGPSTAAYKYDGYYYQQMLSEHKVEINNKLWDRFVIGGVTLNHSSVIEH